ncbi:DNAJC11 domain-containing protein [Algoriphagus yeomjeoni]|uniref:DNAJC11 domain-containing protein n=1 Tax=Algoriphagus yeomjeoni TaxID=291403 RepID=UPI003CE4FB1A
MTLDSFLKLISITADFITVGGILLAIRWSMISKFDNVLALKTNRFLSYLLRLGIIFVAFIFILHFGNYLFQIILIIFLVENISVYWVEEEWYKYLASYLITAFFFIPLTWVVSNIIWSFSLNSLYEFINIFKSENKIKIKSNPVLYIINAKYGIGGTYIDVTKKVSQLIVNNSLSVRASNQLAGDPVLNVKKELIIEYNYNGKKHSITGAEGSVINIPE